jgi:hypothetical protein
MTDMPPMIIRAVLPERAEFVDYLKDELPEAQFCIDQTRNAMDTFLSALEMAGEGPALHMEEDCLIGRNFRQGVLAAIKERPFSVIQFFSMRKADLEVGSRWDRSFMCAVCFYLPPGYSKAIRNYHHVWPGKVQHPTGTDSMVCDWLKMRGEKHWINVPSLVEHRVAKSVIDPRRSSKRQSKTFQG